MSWLSTKRLILFSLCFFVFVHKTVQQQQQQQKTVEENISKKIYILLVVKSSIDRQSHFVIFIQ